MKKTYSEIAREYLDKNKLPDCGFKELRNGLDLADKTVLAFARHLDTLKDEECEPRYVGCDERCNHGNGRCYGWKSPTPSLPEKLNPSDEFNHYAPQYAVKIISTLNSILDYLAQKK